MNKVYSISKWAFYGICLLIILLPASRNWQLLLRGRTATGVTGAYEVFILEGRVGGDRMEYASNISFPCKGTTYITRGPLNYQYRPGRTVKVRYDPADPNHNCLLTFSGIYLNNYAILPLILLTVWGAFYLSFNNYHKKNRNRGGGGLASSPYRPFGKKRGTQGKRGGLPLDYPRISPKDS
jgi:hypothetical protein